MNKNKKKLFLFLQKRTKQYLTTKTTNKKTSESLENRTTINAGIMNAKFSLLLFLNKKGKKKSETPYYTCHMSHIMCHMSRITCQVSHVTCHMGCVSCHMSHVTCDMSHVTYHLSHVKCHMSHITCHMSHVS